MTYPRLYMELCQKQELSSDVPSPVYCDVHLEIFQCGIKVGLATIMKKKSLFLDHVSSTSLEQTYGNLVEKNLIRAV